MKNETNSAYLGLFSQWTVQVFGGKFRTILFWLRALWTASSNSTIKQELTVKMQKSITCFQRFFQNQFLLHYCTANKDQKLRWSSQLYRPDIVHSGNLDVDKYCQSCKLWRPWNLSCIRAIGGFLPSTSVMD